MGHVLKCTVIETSEWGGEGQGEQSHLASTFHFGGQPPCSYRYILQFNALLSKAVMKLVLKKLTFCKNNL